MKKINLMYCLAIFLVCSSLIISGCSNNKNENENELSQFLIATCPTTYAYLKEINMNDDFIVQTDSTADALRLLNSNHVQIAFVGRNAYTREVRSDIIKNEVFDRHTIISKTTNPLLLSNLRMHTIHTYLLEDEILKYEYLNFNHIDKKEIHNNDFSKDFFLVPWKDFDELISQGFNLITIYSGANKVDSFRNPTFFYSEQYEGVVEQIIQAIHQE